MSIVLLQGGGLSKVQLDRLATRQGRLWSLLPQWAFGFFRRHKV